MSCCFRLVLFAAVLTLPGVVHAQSRSSRELDLETQRAALHHEAVIATVAHVASLAFGDYALVAAPLGFFMLDHTTTGCGLGIAMCPADSGYVWLMVSGIASGIVSAFVLFVAMGLDIDRHERANAIRRETVRVVPGPGQIGVALSIPLDS